MYLARDLKHRRQVAIKVLHPELAANLGVERFVREIEIAAQPRSPSGHEQPYGAPEQGTVKPGTDESRLERLSEPALNIKRRRIDLFAFNVPTTLYVLREMRLGPADHEVVQALKETALYYAVNKETIINLSIDKARIPGKKYFMIPTIPAITINMKKMRTIKRVILT